ncbi:uncharacterized protein LOC129624485 isoform X1 [Bubalus kerabau]|uniref:uncharacterized protein LOC129624485 isoform X1 n=1 Tax=Bubalus carabanensis TaxID=3119969 RepID=UPI00244EE620|nr:uncharacterized protein LOC129624485 isoform X1 [Bubalus carabanensis]
MVSSKRSFSVNPFSSFKMLLQGPLEAPLSLVGGACGPPLCGPTFSSTRPPTWRSSLRTAPPNRSVFGVASVLLSSLASAPAAFPLLLLHPPGGSKEASLPSNKSATCPSLCTHCVPPPGLSQVISIWDLPWTKDRTCVTCIGRQIRYHWTTDTSVGSFGNTSNPSSPFMISAFCWMRRACRTTWMVGKRRSEEAMNGSLAVPS